GYVERDAGSERRHPPAGVDAGQSTRRHVDRKLPERRGGSGISNQRDQPDGVERAARDQGRRGFVYRYVERRWKRNRRNAEAGERDLAPEFSQALDEPQVPSPCSEPHRRRRIGEVDDPAEERPLEGVAALEPVALVDAPQQVMHEERGQMFGADAFIAPRRLDRTRDALAERQRASFSWREVHREG